MVRLRNNNPGIRFLIKLWSKYSKLEDYHLEWAQNQIRFLHGLKKDHLLYYQGEQRKDIYIVIKGLVGRVLENSAIGKRQILSVGTPGMGLMTTNHLYSSTPSKGNIVILHSGTQVIQLTYRSIFELRQIDKDADILINVFTNKKKEQISTLRRISLERAAFDKCLIFAEELPNLYRLLTQQEIADILNISRRTVQMASAYLAKRPFKK